MAANRGRRWTPKTQSTPPLSRLESETFAPENPVDSPWLVRARKSFKVSQDDSHPILSHRQLDLGGARQYILAHVGEHDALAREA